MSCRINFNCHSRSAMHRPLSLADRLDAKLFDAPTSRSLVRHPSGGHAAIDRQTPRIGPTTGYAFVGRKGAEW